MKQYFNTFRDVRFVFLFSCILFSSSGYSQSLAFDVLKGEQKVIVPFEYKMGFIILNLKFHNRLPLKFIFDTGTENTVLFQKEMAEIMNLTYDKEVRIQGSDLKNEIIAYITRKVDIEIENLEKVTRDIIVLDKDILELEKAVGFPINGIIGTSFMKGLIVQIDYKHRQLILRDSRSFNKSILQKYTEIPIVISQSKAYMQCSIEYKNEINLQMNLLVDTGAGVSILLYDDYKQEDNDDTKISTGKMGTVVSGSLMGYLGRVQELRFENFTFNNLICNLIQQDSLINSKLKKINKKGLIGNVILSRFDIIFDFFENKLYFKPYKNYNKAFDFDKSGVELYAIGEKLNEYMVNDVVKNSPAYFAGLKKGDKIIKINRFKTRNMKLEDLIRKFSDKEGTVFGLLIKRGYKTFNRKLILFDYLKPVSENQKFIWFEPDHLQVY